MAQLMSVRLSRDGAVPWGFRLQGGKDFGTPLVIQKVNGGSPAEKAGLLAGDAVISVGGTEVFNLRHKDAQDAIVRAGPAFEITVQRGGSTWKPQVTATGGVPKPSGPLPSYITPVTKTSLAAKPQDSLRIGSGHNNQARPFGAHLNGTGGDPVKSIVNKQYNTPVGIYSEQTIAETLSAQAEVLAGGVLGVNFKKNEKIYNAANSEVLKMLQEAENDPEPSAQPNHFYSTASHAIGGRGTSPRPSTPKKAFYEKIIANESQSENVASDESRRSSVPIGQPQTLQIGPDANQASIDNNQSSVPATPLCSLCERFIVGVFVRIKEKNLHVECFKCSTCGCSLKNQGYYSINNKLYCDVHAKLAAIQKPPPGTEGMIPVPVAPGGKIPVSTISAALSAHSTPLNGGTAPPSAAPFSVSGNLSGPKPYGFSSVSSPLSPSIAPVSAPLPTYSAPAPAPVSNPLPSFNNHAATLPRPATQQIPGRFSTLKPGTTFKGAGKGGAFGVSSAPKRGRGILNKAVGPGARVPLCGACNGQVRGPFITALGRIWCPDHFVCVNSSCKRPLADIGFVEEQGQLYCEYCFEQFIAPPCDKCHGKIKGDCLRAIGKNFHPECFTCCYCGKLFGNNPFFLEEGQAYCEADWNELFTTKCFACGFPVEAGDRWVEALSNNYHSQCFNCTMCKKNLEGQSFYAKGGRPFCKNHAR